MTIVWAQLVARSIKYKSMLCVKHTTTQLQLHSNTAFSTDDTFLLDEKSLTCTVLKFEQLHDVRHNIQTNQLAFGAMQIMRILLATPMNMLLFANSKPFLLNITIWGHQIHKCNVQIK